MNMLSKKQLGQAMFVLLAKIAAIWGQKKIEKVQKATAKEEKEYEKTKIKN